MCGRYAILTLNPTLKKFLRPTPPADLFAHFNVAPSQQVLAITNQHPERLSPMRWGLIPSWAKDPAIGNRLINARAETLAEKPAFRSALQRRRCLIPADGFYEWRKEGGKHKTPMFIRLKSRDGFAFAGLWEVWHAPDGSDVPSVTIITTEPNELLKPIHNRMPAIVQTKDYDRWLSAPDAEPVEKLAEVLKPYPAEEMEAYPVTSRVNRPDYDSADCINPAETGLLF